MSQNELLKSVQNLNEQILPVAAAGDKTFVEWFMDYTHKDWGVRKFQQVSVQTWKNGKIVNEKFYYGVV